MNRHAQIWIHVQLNHKSEVVEKCSISRNSASTAAYCTCQGEQRWKSSCERASSTVCWKCLSSSYWGHIFGQVICDSCCDLLMPTGVWWVRCCIVQVSGYWRLSLFLALYVFIVLYFVVTFKGIEEICGVALRCCNQGKTHFTMYLTLFVILWLKSKMCLCIWQTLLSKATYR